MAFWTAARIMPRRERLALHCLKLSGFETYVPRVKERRIIRGRKVHEIAPLFPSYVFILIELQWHAARFALGISALCMDGERPAKVPDRVITDLRDRERGGLIRLPPPPKPIALFVAGDELRVAPNSPHSSAPAPPDRNRWLRRRPSRARKRGANGKRGHTPRPAVSIRSPKSPHSSAPAPPDRNPGRGAALARTRKRSAKVKRGTPRPAVSIRSRRRVPTAPRRHRRIETLAEAPPARARGNGAQRVNAVTKRSRKRKPDASAAPPAQPNSVTGTPLRIP